MVSAPVPPGWEYNDPDATLVTMFVLICDHVSLDKFERGPISMVLESHERFSAPENCRLGHYTFLNILTRILVDDAEVADAIHASYGIPTSYAQIRETETVEPLTKLVRFAWNVTGGEESWVDIGRFDNNVSDNPLVYRYAWDAGTHLGLVDMNLDSMQTQFEPTAVYGSFKDPMLLASAGPLVAGIGAVSDQFFPEGQIKFYEGYECANQIGP
jgi:hypothetical protein